MIGLNNLPNYLEPVVVENDYIDLEPVVVENDLDDEVDLVDLRLLL